MKNNKKKTHYLGFPGNYLTRNTKSGRKKVRCSGALWLKIELLPSYLGFFAHSYCKNFLLSKYFWLSDCLKRSGSKVVVNKSVLNYP